VRWIEDDVNVDSDPKIERLLRKFGNQGLGVLVRLWTLVARKGARPGLAVDTNDEPFDLEYMARQAGTSPGYLRRLLDEAAKGGHIDRDRWKAKELVLFPSLARRSQKFHDAKSGAERAREHRERRFQRIADRDGSKCCRCGSGDHLELERRIPKDEGGGDDDANLQIVCIPCGRSRRAEREARRGQNVTQDVTQDVTGGNVLYGDPSIDPVVSTKISPSIDRSPHEIARAREDQKPIHPGSRLPLIGAVPRPRTNPALLGPIALDGQLPRDHLRCVAPCGRVCVPLKVHRQFIRQLGGDPDTRDSELRAWYVRTLAAIPGDQPIGDDPYRFWWAHFEAEFPSAAPTSSRRAADHSGPNAAAARVRATPEKLEQYASLTRRDGDVTKKRNGTE